MPPFQRAPAVSRGPARISRLLAELNARWPDARRRAGGLALALLIEAGLFLALLTLGIAGKRERSEALTTVEFAPEPELEPPAAEPEKTSKASALPRAVPSPRPDQPRVPQPPFPVPPPAAAALSPVQEPAPAPPASKIKVVVRDDAQGPVGPPDTGHRGDSERVGSMPNGEPIYAARWYREPSADELRGYLSTASGPGWALINCRTVTGYRVEDCVLEGEYPAGSQMGRAVLAAAWQFKVRPPQVGGRVLVGEWVRIRITYEMRVR